MLLFAVTSNIHENMKIMKTGSTDPAFPYATFMNTDTQERSYELVQMFCFNIDSMKLYKTALDQAKKLTFNSYK